MNRGIIKGWCITLVLVINLGLPAQAALVYDWFITNPEQTVDPYDIVFLNARIVNDPGSEAFDLDVAITQANAFFSLTDHTPVFGPQKTNILSQFNGITLAPGESFDFVFATLSPIAPPIPEGLAAVFSLGLIINGVDDTWEVEKPNPQFNVGLCNAVGGIWCQETVMQAGTALITVEAAPIPLPGAAMMMLPALALLGGAVRLRRGI